MNNLRNSKESTKKYLFKKNIQSTKQIKKESAVKSTKDGLNQRELNRNESNIYAKIKQGFKEFNNSQRNSGFMSDRQLKTDQQLQPVVHPPNQFRCIDYNFV